jgi:hypothetical protein
MKPESLRHKLNACRALQVLGCTTLLIFFMGCNSTRDLTKGREPAEVRPQLKPKRTYYVTTKTGEELVIRVTQADAFKVKGFVSYSRSGLEKIPYEETLDNLYHNASKISKKRNDIVYIVIVTGVFATFVTFMVKGSDYVF